VKRLKEKVGAILVPGNKGAWPDVRDQLNRILRVGKPDAGNPHVQFDERGGETERCRQAQATAPLLDSTGDVDGTEVGCQ